MILRRLACILVLTLAVLAPAAGRAATAADAAKLISDLGQRAITALTAHDGEPQKEQQFRALFDEGFAVPTIGRFVLGSYWRTASEAQQQEFLKLFETYIVHSYTVRFSEYSGQQLKITGSRLAGEDAAVVQSQIVQPGGAPPIHVDWQLTRAGGTWKITDVNVEGISMAVTERQEFSSVIQRNGGQVSALLTQLRQKLAAS